MLFEAVALSHRYADGCSGLDGCSLAIRRGSRNALLGANGSGKTTLLQHFNGLLQANSGSLHFAGAPLDTSRAGLAALRRRVGLVFQNPDRQLFSASVVEDVSFGPLNLGLDETTVRIRVAEALAAVGLAGHADRPVHHLSFGQKKRVCIAGVLAMQPEVLLLDEPMAGLDSAMQSELEALLASLTAQGITIVLSTHDVDFAYRWADDIHLLAAGHCLASFAAGDLPQHAEALRQAGQSVPAIVELQRILAAHGLIAALPAMPSLAALLPALTSREAI